MNMEIIEQIKLFLVFFISGIIIGILFDIFRIIRKSFKISDFHTAIEDIIFGLISCIFLIFVMFIYNDGSIRFYMFIAFSIGLIIYLKTISKYFIKINVIILNIFKIIVKKACYILIFPFKYLFKLLTKIFNKPFTMLIINIRKIKNIVIYKKCRKKKNILKKEGIL